MEAVGGLDILKETELTEVLVAGRQRHFLVVLVQAERVIHLTHHQAHLVHTTLIKEQMVVMADQLLETMEQAVAAVQIPQGLLVVA